MQTDIEQQESTKRTLRNAAIVIVAGVMATTLAQPQLLGRIPLQNLLKNELHVSRSLNAAFFFWIGLPWYFKPFMGIISDAFPLFGSRRKSYMLLGAALATISWIGMTLTPHRYSALLTVALVIDLFMVVASTAVGGYMVEQGQALAGSGRLTAVRNFTQQTCFILNGPAAGMLASIPFLWTATTCGGVIFLLVPATIFFLHEQRRKVNGKQMLADVRTQMANIGTAKTMWAAAGLMALFYLAPGLPTATFYKQQNDLGMNTIQQGWLQTLAGIGGVAASLCYVFACKRINLLRLLIICLSSATILSLTYLFYTTQLRAQIIETLYNFGFVLAELALMDLAVRSTPKGSEALGFSLMMSVRNFALYGTDWFGSQLMDKYHLSFNSLVLSNAGTTLVTVPLIFLLPRMLLRRKDAEPLSMEAAPRIATE